uniref:Plectin/S10 N-terminal domain-containing protein n=1 Tax=Parascaris equorum TaxID=6256 RepID=A0A914RH67_PAREQ
MGFASFLLAVLSVQLQFVRLQSLASREFVKERFAWRHHYWYLTNEGINYLREYLHLPAEIVPATVKSKPREPRPAFAGDRLTRGLYSALVHILAYLPFVMKSGL